MISLLPQEIHIWQGTLRPSAKASLKDLAPEELARADRFVQEKHRMRFICNRLMAKEVLAQYLEVSRGEVVFSYDAKGKPFIQGASIGFNLSHADDQWVMAVTEEKVIGIDIEKINPEQDLKLANRFYHPQEIALLEDAAFAHENFFKIWTRKEALLKAVGVGIVFPLNHFNVNVIESESIAFGDLNLYLKDLELVEGYKAAVATTLKEPQYKLFTLEFFES